MDEAPEKTMSPNLWNDRNKLPRMGIAGSVVMLVFTGLLAAISVTSGFGGIFLLCLAAGLQAVLFVVSRRPFVFASAAVAYLLAFLISGSPAEAAIVLVYQPAAIALSAAVYMNFSCTAAMTLTAAALGIGEAAVYAVRIAASGFGVRGYFDSVRQTYLQALTAITVATEKGDQQFFTADAADALITGIVNILPALIVVMLLCAAVIGCKIFFVTTVFMRAGIFKKPWLITADIPTCAIFLIFWLAAMLFSFIREAEAAYYAAENVALIFAVPLIAVGLRTVTLKLNRSNSPFSRMIYIAVIVMCFMIATNLTVSVTAMIGVWVTMRKYVKKKLDESGK